MYRTVFASFAAALLLSLGLSAPAAAGLRFCNETEASAAVAIGYQGDGGDWTSEGWWRVEPGGCTSVIDGDLKRRIYYWRATSKGYSWKMAKFMFCTSPKAFSIVGDEDCAARGYRREGFNEIKLADGVRAFKFTLTPPSGGKTSEASPPAAAPVSPARTTPPAPAGDPPGTHGEPYSVGGLLSGCEGTDTAVVCDLYNDGFRYQVSTGGPTPDATVEWLMDLPVNTPMGWVGDMISYYGALAEVTIREATLEGTDPFAAVRARMQGYWVSVDDPDYALLLVGALFEEYAQNIPSDTRIVEIATTCEDAKGEGPYLIAHPYQDDEDPRCFEIVEATGDRLVLFPLGTMGFLEFRKAG